MATENLKIRVTSDSAQAKRDLGGFDDKLKSTLKSVVSITVALAAAKKAVDFFAQSTKMAMEQEKIFRKLQSAVEITGKAWGSASVELDNLFASLQRTTQYGDTESAEVFQRIITLTGDYEKALTGLPIALDLAASGLFDAGTAARYVGMAMTGNIEMLGRYIAEFKTTTNEQLKNMTASQKVAYAVDVLRKKFGGLAEKELETTAGQVKQLSNYWGDLREAIGDRMLGTISGFTKAVLPMIEEWTVKMKLHETQVDLTGEAYTNMAKLAKIALLETRIETIKAAIDIEKHPDVIQTLWRSAEKGIQSFLGGLAKAASKNKLMLALALATTQDIATTFHSFKEAQKEAVDNKKIKEYSEEIAELADELFKLKGSVEDVPGIDVEVVSGFENIIEQIEETKDITIELIGTTLDYKRNVQDIGNIWEQVNAKLHKRLDEELMYMSFWGNEVSNILYEAFGGSFENIEDYFKNMLKRMSADLLASGLLKLFGGAAVGMFAPGGLFGFLGFHPGGEISNQGGYPVKGASGLDFTVPSGFPNDSFPILVESGESVSVTPSGRGSETDDLLKQLIAEVRSKPVANTILFDDVDMSRYVDRGKLKREYS